MNGRLSITHVAKTIGVTPRTIMRWEKAGKIKRSKRDWRGWRFYLHEDLEDIRKFYESTYEYNEDAKGVSVFAKSAAVVVALTLMQLFAMDIPASAQSDSARPPAITETKSTVNINLAALPVGAAPTLSASEAMKYTLGPDDIIEVDVRRHPEFSGQYTVNAEGKIEYKFIGDIIVNGLTKVQLQERLSEILSEYVLQPEVNVRIVSFLSKTYYVVGEVNRPGKYYMKGNTVTIMDALIAAGLPNQSSATRKCRLISPSAQKKGQYKEVNVYELLYAGDLKENIDMHPGDILYIPSTIIAKVIRIVSPVTNAAASAAGAAASGAALAL